MKNNYRNYKFIFTCLCMMLASFVFGACPTINSYAIYKVADNGDGTCNYTITVCYTTNGNKSIKVVLNCDGTQVVNQCLAVSGTGCQVINFTCACNAVLDGTITPYSGGGCNGSPCTATSIANPTILATTNFSESLSLQNSHVCLQWKGLNAAGIISYTIEFSRDGTRYEILEATTPTPGMYTKYV